MMNFWNFWTHLDVRVCVYFGSFGIPLRARVREEAVVLFQGKSDGKYTAKTRWISLNFFLGFQVMSTANALNLGGSVELVLGAYENFR